MGIRRIADKIRIEAFLRHSPELHIYSLGDLDDFFWPHTAWYAWEDGVSIRELALLYTATALPTVLGISDEPAVMHRLLLEVAPLLPEQFYAHLSPGVQEAFAETHRIESQGRHYKMGLHDTARVRQIDGSAATRLTRHNLDELLDLYCEGYPGNWFDPRMLESGQYFGLRMDSRLVSAAGVHVYSRQYRVAAIGNVVTHPTWRNKGYGQLVTARLCQSLLEAVDHIGLNVKADNEAALACYRKLGFEIIAPYGEFSLTRRS